MKKWLGVMCCSVLALSVTACGKKGTVATVGRDKITVRMMEERLADAPPAYQNYLNTEAGRKQFLDLMVRERLVLEAARQAGVKGSAEYKKGVADFRKEQAKRQKEYEENLLMELYVRELHDKQLNVTDQEVDKYYAAHEREYTHPVEITARHILVPTQAEAEQVMARLKSGEDFAKLAREVSKDPVSAARGGLIGPFRKGDLVPDFEKAVFPLKVGQTSGIVQTQFGYHIIKKTEEKALPPQPAEQSKLEIRKMLEKVKFDTWLENAKKKYNVKINYQALAAMPAPAEQQQPAAPQGNAPVPQQPAE